MSIDYKTFSYGSIIKTINPPNFILYIYRLSNFNSFFVTIFLFWKDMNVFRQQFTTLFGVLIFPNDGIDDAYNMLFIRSVINYDVWDAI